MEEWRSVTGFEGLYEVSNLGNVRTLDSRHYLKNKNQKQNKDGHMRVWLSKGSYKKPFFVHRLVAEAFIENYENKPVVNHLDGKPSNNNVYNLEWATRSENDLHAFRIGLRKPSCGGTSKKIFSVDRLGNIKRYDSISSAARELGCSTGKLSHYLGKDKECFGKYWKELSEGVTTIREE